MMQDALRPDDENFKRLYETGYRQWHRLAQLGATSFLDLAKLDFDNAFPQHPILLPQLRLNRKSTDVLCVTGTSTWDTAAGDCDLPAIKMKHAFAITSASPTTFSLRSDHSSSSQDFFGIEENHVAVLTLAWAYVFAARWTEIIPGASNITYTDALASCRDQEYNNMPNGKTEAIIDLGGVTNEAFRWWAAVLAPGEGWNASIQHNGRKLKSPWSVQLQSSTPLVLHRGATTCCKEYGAPATFATAARYIVDYAMYHGAHDQSCAAFAAALLLPTRRVISTKQICWPLPDYPRKPRPQSPVEQTGPPWGNDARQLDKLLTMSCNTTGVSSLLSSSFIDPDLPCNACGAWIQGAFSVIDSQAARQPHVLARMLMARSPNLDFLWLGAVLVGIQQHIMRWARPVAFNIDLHSAAWTNSLVTFIQRPVSKLAPNVDVIQRSDEARLMFLSQDGHHCYPPLVPFAPFGTSAITDCALEVQMHAFCSGSHGLRYAGWVWDCEEDLQIAQNPIEDSSSPVRAKDAGPGNLGDVVVQYDKLDRDRDISEAMTRNMFSWLRGADGFSVAERDIRNHEWIEDWGSSEDESVAPEGDGRSTASRHIGPWIRMAMTTRSHTV